MKLPRLAIGLCASLTLGLSAAAQQQSAPTSPEAGSTPQQADQAQAAAAVQNALGGVHVAVLQNPDGGIVAVQNQQGENALLAFLEPSAAQAVQAQSEDQQLTVSALPLLQVLSTWKGPLLFEGSNASIEQAQALKPEAEGFNAPVYVVLADGQETQITTEAGAMTPILLNYSDAEDMKSRVEQSVDAEMTVEVVPVEFGAVLLELVNMQQDKGYRVFTHPDTIQLIQAARAAAPQGNQQ